MFFMNVLQAAPDLSRRSRGQEQNRTNAGLELDHTDEGSGGSHILGIPYLP